MLIGAALAALAAGVLRTVVGAVLIALAAGLFLVAVRYAFFAALSLLAPPAPPPATTPRTRFCVLAPAHNEERSIRPTLAAARSLAYPSELFRVVALADNCDDATAQLAREAGVETIVRVDPEHPGKGQALAWAIANHLRPDEALVICDADSRPAPDYLTWMDRALAAGDGAAQGFNAAGNPDESSLAALAALTSEMKNGLHYAGKTAAGLPAPLMNGLTIAAPTLARHPWQAFSIVEDFETYLNLVANDVPIRFVREAKIFSPRASRFAHAATQKERWSGGQSELGRRVAWPLVRRAWRERSLAKWSAACDVLAPGYALVTALLAAVAFFGVLLFPRHAHPAAGLAFAGLLLMGAQFAVGLTRLRWTPRLAKAVLLAPVYMVWKSFVAARSAVTAPRHWRRAARP